MIGLLPAAGTATRIHGLPKFLLPIADTYLLRWHIQGMASVCDRVLVETSTPNMRWLADYAQGASLGLAQSHATMTQTALSAWHAHTFEEPVLFSMPDTYWTGAGVFDGLSAALQDGADVAVAVFRARAGQHAQGGMCQIKQGRVTKVVDKSDRSTLKYIWGALAWSPRFWWYLDDSDPHVGYGLPRAIEAGLDVRAVVCDGEYFDCGTPERYFECIRSLGVSHAETIR